MELYKVIENGTRLKKYEGGYIVLNNIIYTNPKEEIIRKAGFKEYEDTPLPEYNKDLQYIETKYIDGDVITAEHTIKNLYD